MRGWCRLLFATSTTTLMLAIEDYFHEFWKDVDLTKPNFKVVSRLGSRCEREWVDGFEEIEKGLWCCLD